MYGFQQIGQQIPNFVFDFQSLVCLFLFFHQTIGLANKFVKIHKNKIRNLLSDPVNSLVHNDSHSANLDYKRVQQTKLNRYLEFRTSLV